jgi:extradiol dioxygenase family protein
MAASPFHLAFPVTDLEAARRFYVGVLGCRVGREAERWIDFDFFGHQLSAHLAQAGMGVGGKTPVDGRDVPVPHFGLILGWEEWHGLADRLKKAGTRFLIEPYVRFKGEPGEQATMFFSDPSGNNIEIKAFQDQRSIFER